MGATHGKAVGLLFTQAAPSDSAALFEEAFHLGEGHPLIARVVVFAETQRLRRAFGQIHLDAFEVGIGEHCSHLALGESADVFTKFFVGHSALTKRRPRCPTSTQTRRWGVFGERKNIGHHSLVEAHRTP